MDTKLTYSDYYSAVLGGWLGKFIGGTLGAPLEGAKVLHDKSYYDEVPETAAWNDDSDFQLMWLMLLEERGVNLSARDMAKHFQDQISYPWCEYGYAWKNWDQGIWPPVSGWFNNDYFLNSMGCPVRSDIWAFLHPGQPQRAVDYARKDASIDHADESTEAEVFLAALESMLFFEKDLHRLIEIGMEWIRPDCRLAGVIRRCIDLHADGTDWKLARHTRLNMCGHPDFTAALQNLGLIALALLYGEGDFERTVLLALNGGYDSDCTCATAGAIVGAIIGAEAIPAKWREPLNDTFTAILKKNHELSISGFAERTCRMGLHLIDRNGENVQITDVPEGVAAKLPADTEKVAVDFEYDGLPTIKVGSSRVVQLVLTNRTDADIECTVDVSPAKECYAVSLDSEKVLVPAGQTATAAATITAEERLDTLPQTNLFEVTIRSEGDVLQTESFGLAGEHYWEAFGAFWDVLDESKIPPGTMVAHHDPGLPAWDCMFANEIGIDREYLDETALAKGHMPTNVPRAVLTCPEDRIELNTEFSLDGPAVVYLRRQIIMPEKREAWLQVGNNGPVALWVNGQCVATSDQARCGNNGDAYAEVTLNEGVNTIVFKVGRWSNTFAPRFGIKNHNGEHFHQCFWMTDFESVVL